MANHKNITRTEDTRQKKTRTQDKNEATKNRLQLKESFIFFTLMMCRTKRNGLHTKIYCAFIYFPFIVG